MYVLQINLVFLSFQHLDLDMDAGDSCLLNCSPIRNLYALYLDAFAKYGIKIGGEYLSSEMFYFCRNE